MIKISVKSCFHRAFRSLEIVKLLDHRNKPWPSCFHLSFKTSHDVKPFIGNEFELRDNDRAKLISI